MTGPSPTSAGETAPRWGFALFLLAVTIAITAAAVPGARSVVVAVLAAPARLFGAIAPGAGAYEDARLAGRLLGWLGWLATPLLALPLATLVAGLAGVRGLAAPLAEATRRAADVVDGASTWLGEAARWLAPALVVVVAVIVAQRYVFGLAFTKLQELVIYLHAGLFLLAAAPALLAERHVRVDVIYGELSPRARAGVNLAGSYVFLILTCVMLLRHSGSYIDATWRVLEGSTETDGLAIVYLLKTLIPVFAVLMIAQGASIAGRAALVLIGEEAPAPPAVRPEGV